MDRANNADMVYAIVLAGVWVLLLLSIIVGKEQPTLESVQESIYHGTEWLKTHQTGDGSFVHDNFEKWPVWDTANALMALDINGMSGAAADNGVEYLLRNQNADGSFFIRPNLTESDIETTSAVAVALYYYNNKTITPELSRTLRFLSTKQEADGGWTIGSYEFVSHDRRFPSVACYASMALGCANYSYNKQKGAEFIISGQKTSGDWGVSSIYYDTFFYSINACVHSLLANGNNAPVEKTPNFILSSQDFDGGWSMMEFGSTIRRETKTALALNALLVSPNFNRDALNKGVRWLLRQQQAEGRWKGGYIVPHKDKSEDLFATAQAVIALSKYRDLLKNDIQNTCY